MKKWLSEAKQHLMTGISFALPIIIGGSLVVAIAKMIGFGFGVSNLDDYADASGFLHYVYLFQGVGWTAIGLLNVILAAYIAYSIGGKPALAAGFVGGSLAISTNAGFLGAVIAGFFAGYLTILIKNKVQIKGAAASTVPLIILPLITVGLTGILMALVLGGPLGALNQGLIDWINSMTQSGTNKVLLAVILGAMIGFDLGGPVNKAAWMAGNALLASGIYLPNIMINIAICIPPLGYAIATVIRRSKFNATFREAGNGAWIMGMIGITEGAIPFTLRNPLKMIPLNMIGCATGAAITILLGAYDKMPPIGGLYGTISIGNPFAYLIGGISGALIIAIGAVLLGNFNDEEEVKTSKTAKPTEEDEIELVLE